MTTSVGKMTQKNNIAEKIVEIERQNVIKVTTMEKKFERVILLS